ncbi:MAG: DUF4844 domain-containing protein [Burkholderiales bacterium]|nr:DUF4844 domain-containing protein [Burkholderiales bacterium]
MCQHALVQLPATPRRSVVLAEFKTALTRFESHDSEEQEQYLNYLQRIMSILGIADSGELFNVWRYGFPYGWMINNGTNHNNFR